MGTIDPSPAARTRASLSIVRKVFRRATDLPRGSRASPVSGPALVASRVGRASASSRGCPSRRGRVRRSRPHQANGRHRARSLRPHGIHVRVSVAVGGLRRCGPLPLARRRSRGSSHPTGTHPARDERPVRSSFRHGRPGHRSCGPLEGSRSDAQGLPRPGRRDDHGFAGCIEPCPTSPRGTCPRLNDPG